MNQDRILTKMQNNDGDEPLVLDTDGMQQMAHDEIELNDSQDQESCHSNDSNDLESAELSHTEEMSLDQCKDMTYGMMQILSVRLVHANESNIDMTIQKLWRNERYVELLSFARVLSCHFKKPDSQLSDLFEQMAGLIDPIVDELGLRNDPDYLIYSLEGALEYILCCFNDGKLSNSQDVNSMLYNHMLAALDERNFYKMYGMLLSFQTLLQKPEKDIVYDIIHEHLVALCPGLEEESDDSY